MSTRISVTVHEIRLDGLPDMTELTGRVAFITDGVVVSGWPMLRGPQENRWEADPEVFGCGLELGPRRGACLPPPVSGVTHWLEFPVPVEELTGG